MENKKFLNSFKYAFNGIIISFRTEKNMKIHILMMLLVVIAAELFNTAIETVVNMITMEKNEKAKIAKDVSAGAVLVTAIGSAIVGLIIFIPKVVNIL